MTVRDNIAFGLKVRKRPKAEIRDRVDELLALVQLGASAIAIRRSSRAGSGSGWRSPARSRREPRVLLLDEPFGALDANVRAELREWLRRLHDEVHVTTVFVTHDQQEAMEVSDRSRHERRAHRAGRVAAGALRRACVRVRDALRRRRHPFAGGLVRPHELDVLRARARRGGGAGRPGDAARIRGARPPAVGRRRGVSVQLTRREVDELDLARGDIVWVRSSSERAFA